jgi:uncharacterized protein
VSARTCVTDEPSATQTLRDTPREYMAPAWLPGGQMQTIYAYYLKLTPAFAYRRERWDTPDGDFIDLDWLDGFTRESKLLVLFHGLEGCSRSHYAVSLMNQLRGEGWCGIVPHFRGCGGEINRLQRSYHAADSAEVDWILRRLRAKHRGRLYAVGISLGGNMLLKWLGEQGERAVDVVERAVAVSAPVDLQIATKQLDCGWKKRIYAAYFLRTMKPKVLAKIATHGLDLDPRAIRTSATFREIDNLYTAPVHGFRDADDYWMRSSSKPWLRHITVPTLLISAINDPFFPGHALPTREEVSEPVALEYPQSGGHVGFVSGRFPGHIRWLPRRILSFLASDD